MIASLSGIIQQKTPGNVIVEVGGIGFAVTVPLTTYYLLPEVGTKVLLIIHSHIREDAFTLFGFISSEEKIFFEKLISISGIGPKLAVNILSGITVNELRQAIMEGDISRITSIPGLGKKTAGRIILELKDKVSMAEYKGIQRVEPEPVISDAVSALINLGYGEGKAEVAVTKAKMELGGDTLIIEELIKKALKLL